MANVTSSRLEESKVSPGRYEGFVEFTVDESTLTAAATTEALTITGFPANAYPTHASISVGEFFTGGSVSAMTAEIGDSGDPNGLVAALNVFDTTSKNSWQVSTDGVEAKYNTTEPAAESAFAPEILFTATGDNVINCDAGFLAGRVYYERYDD